jgi:hypothetical protein
MNFHPLGFLGVAAAVCACAVSHVFADDKPAVPPPASLACMGPEFRQFDFWLGEWEVRDATGKLQGTNRIVSAHKGCALEEHWTGAGGFSGTSLNLYDAGRKQWHQTWVDSTGALLQLDGGLVDGRMVLSGATPSANSADGRALQRIAWTPLPDGRVRQLWESSADGGKTWTVTFDGYYTKVIGARTTTPAGVSMPFYARLS